MTDDTPPSKEDIMFDAAKKSSKQILAGLGKAGMLFTKRMAEGAFNAQIRQSQEEETSDRLKAAGQELGKAFLKAAVEGGSVGMTSLVEGVGTFTKEMAKYSDNQTNREEGKGNYDVGQAK